MRIRVSTCAVAVLGAGLIACGSEPEEPSVAAAPPAAAIERDRHAELEALKQQLGGSARVSVEGDRISLDAREAPPRVILIELEHALGFELLGGELPREPLTLQLEDRSLGEVLTAVLPGTEFQLQYAYDAGTGSHRVARVLVGEVLLAALSPEAEAEPPAARGQRGQRRAQFEFKRRQQTPEELEKIRRDFLARDEAARAVLDDPDPVVRAEAVPDVDIEGPGRDQVFALAESDPDPAVRSAALELLFEEDSQAAREALYQGLSDEDPGVVLKAIDLMEGLGEEEAIPYLQPVFEGHPDPRVRQRAGDVIQYLE